MRHTAIGIYLSALLLAGCGGDGGVDTTPAVSEAPTSTPAPPPPPPPPPPNKAPVASFTAAPSEGTTDTVFGFDAGASADTDGTVASYLWDFGDGTSATGRTASTRYAEPGTYTVTLTVTDDDGAEASATRPVAVSQASAQSSAGTTCAADAPGAGGGAVCIDGAMNEGRWVSGPEVAGLGIEATRTSCTAPCGVHVSAAGTDGFQVERPLHDLQYLWEFGDPDSEFEALPDDFPFGRDANRAQGPFAGHVYAEPGTYEVALTVSAGDGTWARTVQTIDVADPDATFAGEATVCLSTPGDFAGCPDGAVQHTVWTEAFEAVPSGQAARYLLRAGERFEPGAAQDVKDRPAVVVASYGEGAKPTVITDGWGRTSADMFRFRNVDEATLTGLSFQGDYDPTTGAGDALLISAIGNVQSLGHLTIYRIASSGLQQTLNARAGMGPIIFADNVVTDWRNYGVFTATDAPHAFVGNSIRQNENAASGDDGKQTAAEPAWADHGPLRFADSFRMAVSRNDMLAMNGWSSAGKAHNPAFRYNTRGLAGHSGVLSENRMEGGFVVLALTVMNTRTQPGEGNVIVERNALIGTDNTSGFVNTSYGGTTLRNNVMIMPDVKNTFNGFWRQLRLTTNDEQTDANLVRPIRIEHNTLAVLQTAQTEARDTEFLADDSATHAKGAFADVVTRANQVYAPYMPNASDFANATPVDAGDGYRPQTGNPTIGASGRLSEVLDTYDGRVRRDPTNDGAQEPPE